MTDSTRNIGKVQRLVVKVGSALIAEQGDGILESIAEQIHRCRAREVLLVTSGAIALGFEKLGHDRRPSSVVDQQAAAAVGQPLLMQAWQRAFFSQSRSVAQVLLTHSDLDTRERYLNARSALLRLLDHDIIPVVNENDSVATEEITVGDNDQLAAHLAGLIDADLLVLLTTVDGVFEENPIANPDAQRIGVIADAGESLGLARDRGGGLGRGGMHSKLRSAHAAQTAGVPVIIANGRHDGVLLEILESQDVGTYFPPLISPQKRKHWIRFTKKVRGTIEIDQGAKRALSDGQSSLLLAGVIDCRGDFRIGDAISLDCEGERIGLGLSNYPADEVARLKGMSTEKIEATMGYLRSRNCVHRSNMVMLADDDAIERGPS